MKRINVRVLVLAALTALVLVFAGCSSEDESTSLTNEDLYNEFAGTIETMLTKAANEDGTMKDQVSGDENGFIQFTTGAGSPISMYFEKYSDDGEFIFSGTLSTPSGDANDLFWNSLGTTGTGQTTLEGTITLSDSYEGCTIQAEAAQLTLTLVATPDVYMTIEGEMTVQSMDAETSEIFVFQAADIRV
jgi:hypothetical protein